ncbi:hypothetical protein [Bradyrhizobium sp. LMG 9283]|uniref:hypothetical protein n=1 Tax=Bradyrhizobium sp. LMG 9283 TaxID=592064 RepID=UPI0038910532
MRRLAHRPHLTFLDSAARHELLGRYSYLTCDPFSTYRVDEGQASCNGAALDGDPWIALRDLLAKYTKSIATISRHSKEVRRALVVVE